MELVGQNSIQIIQIFFWSGSAKSSFKQQLLAWWYTPSTDQATNWKNMMEHLGLQSQFSNCKSMEV